ncbi:carbohydrate deacetylase [Chloroflexota bacterium]
MGRKLIVNADDYGLTRMVSAGIRSAHIKGIVTSTTVMMNMPGVEEDLEAAQQECPNLGLGVHLVLTAGKPLSQKGMAKTLVTENGSFPKLKGFLDNLEAIDIDQVQEEWEKQTQRFIRLTGKNPDHLDSHHHTSNFSSELFKLLLDIADINHCAIRNPMTKDKKTLSMYLLPELENQFMDFIPALIDQYTPGIPDSFYASFYGQYATLDHLLDILADLPEGVSEIMCHPGYNNPELEKISSYSKERDREREILEDILLRAQLSDLEIELINFGNL